MKTVIGWFTTPKKCDKCEWDLELLLEKIQLAIIRNQDIKEEDKKRLSYIKDLVNVMYKYIELKENM